METNRDPTGRGWSVPGSLAEPDPSAGPGDGGSAASGVYRPRGGVGDADPLVGDGSPDSTGAFSATGPIADAATDVPRLRLQPMTLADILDGAFAIIKARPARVLGITAVFVAPIHLLLAYLMRDSPGAGFFWDVLTSDDPAVTADAEASSGPSFLVTLLALFLPILALNYVAAAIAYLAGAWTVGRDVPAGELLGVVLRRSWPLIVTWVIVHVLEMVGCYIGTLFVMGLFVATAPVIGAEALGPMKALGRAANLAMRRYWATLGISILIGIVSILLSNTLGSLPLLVTSFVFDYELSWGIAAASGTLSAILTTAFVASATTLLYLDLRIRTEGLDLELAAIDLAHDAR